MRLRGRTYTAITLVICCCTASAYDVLSPSNCHEEEAIIFGEELDSNIEDTGIPVITGTSNCSYYLHWAVRIFETDASKTNFIVTYYVVVGNDVMSNLREFTDSPEDWLLVKAAVMACAAVSSESDWHSDELCVGFDSVVRYTTAECRSLVQGFEGHTESYIRNTLRDAATIEG